MDPKEIAENIPYRSPVQPQQLTLDSEFQFNCHPGVSCFNECCRNIDILLMPYDIIRLKQHLGIDSQEFVGRYTVPFEMDAHGMPGLRMATKPGSGECVFLGEGGCTVYEDRPSACRYYALGNMAVRKKDASQVEEVYFIVKEDHCKGHFEPREQTVAQYRKDQGLEDYDAMNREWRDIVIKKRSSGPTVGRPSERSLQLFDMCSYDMDGFRDFIRSEGFSRIFAVPEDELRELIDDQEKLLAFSMRFLKQVLFGEMSIPRKAGAREQRIAERKAVWAERRKDEARRRKEAEEDLKYSDEGAASDTIARHAGP